MGAESQGGYVGRGTGVGKGLEASAEPGLNEPEELRRRAAGGQPAKVAQARLWG